MKIVGLLLFLCLSITACVPSASAPPTVHAVQDGQATAIAFNTAASRGVYFRQSTSGQTIICAENPPDIGLSGNLDFANQITLGSDFAQQTDTPGGLSTEQTIDLVQKITKLTNRTQAIEAQRDALYRLCEAHANGALAQGDVRLLYREILFTLRLLSVLQLLETAETSLSDEQFSALLNRLAVESSILESGSGFDLP